VALNADEIAEQLEFSRSNVSMGLKELQAWRLVNLRHLPGDRREYFDAPDEAWAIVGRWSRSAKTRDRPTHVLRDPDAGPSSGDGTRRKVRRCRLIELLTAGTPTSAAETERLVSLRPRRPGAKALELKDDPAARPPAHGCKGTEDGPGVLARIQFGANISFHILFPTITIALGWMLLFFKLRFNATRDEAWMDAYRSG
jgi:hypothetical protein